MRRREFITLFRGAAAAWPLAGLAQQPERMRRIGVMIANAESDPEGQARIIAFRKALQELGWTEGRNVQIDIRWAAGEPEHARTYTAELVSLAPDLILVNATPALAALQRATTTIPVVFVVIWDPVGARFVQSLARPGGNITGFSSSEPEIGGKWLELLNEIAPGPRRVAGILDPDFKGFAALWHAIESVAPGIGLEAKIVPLRNSTDDIEAAVAAFAQQPGGGLIVLPTGINNINRDRIISLAARHRLPAVYPYSYYGRGGGLICYGFDSLATFRRGASYVDRILKGARPADLPVQAPVKYELVINLKTAKALGLTIPPALLALADEVID